MNIIFGIFFPVLLMGGTFFIGSIFFRRKFDFTLKDIIIRSVLGLGVFSYVVFIVGLLTTKINFLHLFIAISFAALIIFSVKYKLLSSLRFEKSGFRRNLLDHLIFIAIFLLVAGHFIQALSPLIRWDAATQHYLVPKIWLDAGRIVPAPETIFSEYPSSIEMLYMMGLQSGGESLANITGWVLSLLLGLAIYQFARERFSARTGLVSLLAFFSMPLILECATGGLIDIGYTLFVWISFWMFIEYIENNVRGRFYLSAIFAGFALGSKHLAIEYIASLMLAFLIFIFLTKKIKFTGWIKDFALFSLIAFLFGLPWYLKSYFFTGNPIFPFLPALFNHVTEAREPISVHAWSRPDYQRSLITLLTYPWKLTTDFTFLDFWIMAINPIFLGSVPFWIFFRQRYPSRFFMFSISFIVIFLLIAYRIAPSATRYMLPLLCILSVISGASLVFLADDFKRVGRIALVIVLIIPFMFNFLVEIKRIRDIAPWFSGKESKEDIFRSHFEGYDSIAFINEKLPINAVVLTTDPKGYFINRRFIIGTPGAQSQLIPPWSEPDSMRVLEGWKKAGVTHMLFNLSRNVMKNSYFVYTVTKGIAERGELLMTADELADLTKYETEYTYKPEEIAEFGRITQTPTVIRDGKTYFHLTADWWERTVKQDKSQFMLRHYLNLKPYLREIVRFKTAVVYEIQYPENFN